MTQTVARKTSQNQAGSDRPLLAQKLKRRSPFKNKKASHCEAFL